MPCKRSPPPALDAGDPSSQRLQVRPKGEHVWSLGDRIKTAMTTMSLPNSPLSLWLDTYGPYTPEPPLKGEINAYMERAVYNLDRLILDEKLECSRIRPGFLRVATAPGYIRRLQHDVALMK